MKLKAVSIADKKNGARDENSPNMPPRAGPIIKPTPNAAPIIPKFFVRSLGADISAK